MKRISLLILLLACGWFMSSCSEDILEPQLKELMAGPEDEDEGDNPPTPPPPASGG